MVDRIEDWSLSANGNTSVAGVSLAEGAPFANMNNTQREIMAAIRNEFAAMQATITAAALTTITGSGEFAPLGGNTTITGFDTAATGLLRELRVLGTPLIKYNATSLITPDGVDFQAAADDLLRLRSLGAGNWLMAVDRKTGQTTIGKHMIPFLAAAFTPATTNGPAPGQTETTTNKVNFKTLDFDATTAESAWVAFPAPTSSDESRGILFEYDWTYGVTATGSGVAFSLALLARSDGEDMDTAMGTAVTVTDSKVAAGVKHTSAQSTTVTPSGTWAAGDMLFAKIARVPSDAADLVTADAQLMAVRMFLITNEAVDTTP
jgi:hypothetical protein